MNPRAAVAIILASGVVAVLISGSSFQRLWVSNPDPLTNVELDAWSEVVGVIIGALSAYMVTRDNGGKDR